MRWIQAYQPSCFLSLGFTQVLYNSAFLYTLLSKFSMYRAKGGWEKKRRKKGKSPCEAFMSLDPLKGFDT